MQSSLDQFVLNKASKNLGGVWADEDYIVRDRVRTHNASPASTQDRPWFSTITAPDIPPSIDKRGYSATREQAMADFKGAVDGKQRQLFP
jgi:hypothetical protein